MEEKLKAIVYYGFNFKKLGFDVVKKRGFKLVLIARNVKKSAFIYFDEVFDLSLSSKEDVVHEILNKYDVLGILTNYEKFVVERAYFAQALSVKSMSLYNSATTRNKALQRIALEGLESNIEFHLISNFTDATEMFQKFGSDVYLKTLSGVKSRFIYHVKNLDDLEYSFNSFFASVLSLDSDLYSDFSSYDIDFNYFDPRKFLLMEKAYYGQQISIASFASNDEVFICPSLVDVYTAQNLGRDDSFLAFRILPSKLDNSIFDDVSTELKKIIKRLGIRNSAQYPEFIFTDKGEIKLIEIGSRIGGYRHVMYDYAYGFDFNEILIDSVLGKFKKYDSNFKQYVAALEIFPKKSGKFEKIKSLDLLKNDEKAFLILDKNKEGDLVGKAKDGFKPVLTFYLLADNYDELYKKCLFYQNELEVVLKT